ncbi:MAG: sulfatase [bacterium]|nr:sulfatase [bacterium]
MQNILLIAVDTLRPDHLGCYGYPRATSPHLDRLAAESARFTQCWSASNFTAPAFTSLFTGLYPNHHRVFDFGAKVRLSPVHEALNRNNVRMGGVVTFRFFRNLLEDIWGELEVVTEGRSFDYAKELPRAVSDGAVEWLQAHDPSRPFALFLHYDGPHQPIRLPDQWADHFGDIPASAVDPKIVSTFYPQDHERFDNEESAIVGGVFKTMESIDMGLRRLSPVARQWLIDRYDDAVRYNDAEIGRVLAALDETGLSENTLVAVISDHGEELMDHGHISHGGMHLYESTIRTVAMVRRPGDRTGVVCDEPISHVQLLPWLLREAGADDLPAAWRDLDLLAHRGQQPLYCVGEFKCAVRRGNLKYIRRRVLPEHSPRKRMRLLAKMLLMREWGDELFDLGADPQERHNLVRTSVHRRELSSLLDAHLASESRDLGFQGVNDLSDTDRQRIEDEMRRLGYM